MCGGEGWFVAFNIQCSLTDSAKVGFTKKRQARSSHACPFHESSRPKSIMFS